MPTLAVNPDHIQLADTLTVAAQSLVRDLVNAAVPDVCAEKGISTEDPRAYELTLHELLKDPTFKKVHRLAMDARLVAGLLQDAMQA